MRFITKNMDGAGSIVVMNFVANVAPKDGTVIAALQRNLALVQIMGQKGPRFKAQEINWLGSLANEAGVCAIAKRTGVKSFEDAFTREFVMGGTGPNDTEIQPALLNNTLGTKLKLIKGMPSLVKLMLKHSQTIALSMGLITNMTAVQVKILIVKTALMELADHYLITKLVQVVALVQQVQVMF